jgi:hypothetical protein
MLIYHRIFPGNFPPVGRRRLVGSVRAAVFFLRAKCVLCGRSGTGTILAWPTTYLFAARIEHGTGSFYHGDREKENRCFEFERSFFTDVGSKDRLAFVKSDRFRERAETFQHVRFIVRSIMQTEIGSCTTGNFWPLCIAVLNDTVGGSYKRTLLHCNVLSGSMHVWCSL